MNRHLNVHMGRSPQERLLGIYERALRLLPASCPSSYRDQQLELFRHLLEETAGASRWALWSILARATLDLFWNLPKEYRRVLQSGTVSPQVRGFRHWLKENIMHDLRSEVRHAVRALIRAPLFSLAVVATFALGIGANSAVFSIVNGVLLRELPYLQPERIVRLLDADAGSAVTRPIPYLNFWEWVDRSDAFESAAAFDEWTVSMTGQGEPEKLEGGLVNAAFFEVLGVRPALGRLFSPQDDTDGRDRVVILSNGFWRRKFGSDESVVGRSVNLNGVPHEVVGVLGTDFEDPLLAGMDSGTIPIWRPLGLLGLPAERLPNRGSSSYTGIARLKTGLSLEQTQVRLDAISEQLRREFPEDSPNAAVVLTPLREAMVGDVRYSLGILMAAVVLVLAIAVVNVANLFLTRGSRRRFEFALKTALGASRLRLVRQSLIESLLLAITGGGVGLLVALGAIGSIRPAVSAFLPRAALLGLDWRVLAFTAGIGVLAGLGAGILPALRLTGRKAAQGLVETSRGGSQGKASIRGRSALVMCQVCCALVLFAGAGLLIKSLWQLTKVETGFRDSDGVLTFRLALPSTDYPEASQMVSFYERLLDRLEALPGVESGAAVNLLPLSGGFDGNGIAAEDLPKPRRGQELSAQVRSLSGDYFRTMGIRLVQGRLLTDEDAGGPAVTVVNRALALRLWGSEDALGKSLTIAGEKSCRVVGVVDNVKHLALDEPDVPRVYVSDRQNVLPWQLRRKTLVLRTAGNPLSLVQSVRTTVRTLDSGLPLSDVRTMRQYVTEASASPRFRAYLFGAFAALAIALTLVGIYGVISYAVSQGMRNIAIRMALGAQRRRVTREVLSQGMIPIGTGIALGLLGALALSRWISAFLFQVEPEDPWILAVSAILLSVVGAAAVYSPARRAGRADPIALLRSE